MTDARRHCLVCGQGRRAAAAAALAVITAVAARAEALQPLQAFLQSAAKRNFDNREAASLATQRAHEAAQAWQKLLPAVTAQGDYLRNQYEVAPAFPTGGIAPATRTIMITPLSQWDVILGASVPLVDVATWRSAAGSAASRDAQGERVAAMNLEVQKAVARTWFQLVGVEAVMTAARRILAAAEENARFITTRYQAGLVSDLDVKRINAEVERDRQAVEEADFAIVTTRRSLETLTGLSPSPGSESHLDDLREEAPLDDWLAGVDALPSVKAARLDAEAADHAAASRQAALLPSLAAQGNERFTNAVGFGRSPYYSVGVVAAWKLDLGTYQSSRADRAASDGAVVRYDRARATAADAIFNAWHQTRTQIAKSHAARTQREATREAVELARQRYNSGKATLLDVTQSERDDFSAEVSLLQADADLEAARAVLRLSAGRFLTEERR